MKPLTKDCSHKANTCSGCIAEMIDALVATSKWQTLACPDTTCRAKLKYEDVQAFASQKSWEM
jgi:hypothetical protein